LAWALCARGQTSPAAAATSITIAVNIPVTTGPAQTIQVSIPLQTLANALAPLLPAALSVPPFSLGNSGALWWVDRNGVNPPQAGAGPFVLDILPLVVPRLTAVNQFAGLQLFHGGVELQDGTITTGYADGETPAGLVDGKNAAFTLAHAPVAAPALFLNGLLQRTPADYKLTGAALVFAAAPDPAATITVFYRW
jgi:hypothetical protein